jgi:hypothetical protein
MTATEDRIRSILEKIDPSVRRARLLEQQKDLEQRFVDTCFGLENQRRLVARHEEALKTNATPTQVSITAQAAEGLRLQELLVEHLADEVERVQGALDEIQKAGLPKQKVALVED